MNFEIVQAMDFTHFCEAMESHKTLRKHKPEMLEMPWTIFYDETELAIGDLRHAFKYPKIRFVPWSVDYECSQREKMLASLVIGVARHCDADFYFKLDTDTIAINSGDWARPEWFEYKPAWIGQKWSYTKPATMLDQLDAWADTIPSLRERTKPPREVRGNIARHRRLISWAMWGNTSWLREIVWRMNGRMPCGSQDTTISYCATRLGSLVRYVDMKAAGFRHIGRGGEKLRSAVEEVLK